MDSPNQQQQQKQQHQLKEPLQQHETKHFGITPPISLAKPSPKDIIETKKLHRVLEAHGVLETQQELNQSLEILAKLNILLKQWIKDLSVAKQMPEIAARKLGGQIFTFGSYRLGVYHKGADIDALCVAPCNIEHTDFSTSFFDLLEEQPEVITCRAVEEGFIPVIKINYDGIEINLLFARLPLKEIPDDFDLRDENLLKNLDARSLRPVTEYCVTDEILTLVPNIENFRLALRAVKLWAKKHGIYSHCLGYFGGVTWAILVARTCQLFPNAVAATIVHRFFMLFSNWTWTNSVLLKHPHSVYSYFIKVWNPYLDAADHGHLMPIITPANPQQNSTYNVSESTKKIIMSELIRGNTIIGEIMNGNYAWERLFKATSFFYRYRYFIVLLVESQTVEDHLKWCRFVETRIPVLIGHLERDPHISHAHVNPKCFSRNKSENSHQLPYLALSSMWFIGVEYAHPPNLRFNLYEHLQSFEDIVKHRGAATEVLKEGMILHTLHIQRELLSLFFGSEVEEREVKLRERDNEINNLIIRNLKRPFPDLVL